MTENDECPVCTALCMLIGGDQTKCKDLTERFNKGEISADELDAQLKEQYGTASVDLAKEQINEELEKDGK